MPLFRKKPVEIEAVQWTGKNVLEIYSFMHGKPDLQGRTAADKWDDFTAMHEDKDWHIKTLEDGPNGEAKHVASIGDWIIRGVQGELYPCKPDIFEITYTALTAANTSAAEPVTPADIELLEFSFSRLPEEWRSDGSATLSRVKAALTSDNKL